MYKRLHKELFLLIWGFQITSFERHTNNTAVCQYTAHWGSDGASPNRSSLLGLTWVVALVENRNTRKHQLRPLGQWNTGTGLPSGAVDAPSLEIFKVMLDQALSTWWRCGYPWSLQGSGTSWPLREPSNSHDPIIVWTKDSTEAQGSVNLDPHPRVSTTHAGHEMKETSSV